MSTGSVVWTRAQHENTATFRWCHHTSRSKAKEFKVKISRAIGITVNGPVCLLISTQWQFYEEKRHDSSPASPAYRAGSPHLHNPYNFSERSSRPPNSALIGSLSNDDGDLKENGNNAIGLDWQNNNFARASRFLYISLPSLHDYNFAFLFLNFDTVL